MCIRDRNGSGPSQILQWDLESDDITNFEVVHTSSTISAGALQLGIDRRIYRAQLEFSTNTGASRYLGIINNPEANWQDVTYNQQGVLLDVDGSNQNISQIGLPPFIQSLFNSEIDIIQNGISTTELALCVGDSYTLQAEDIPGADYIWSFDGNELTETSPQLLVDTPGFYEVYIEPNNGDCPIEGSAVVGVFDIPVANPMTDIIVCDDISNDGIEMFLFDNKDEEALLDQTSGQYNVGYYESMDDASNRENEISFPYLNIENPQTIYVRVDNSENTNCFDITTFEIEVLTRPQVFNLDTIEFCDNQGDVTDGIALLELENLIPSILGTQDEAETNITFHTSQENADQNLSALPLNYTNTSPINETIFVRIENATNTDCYSTGSFDVIVNPIPVANDISILQCDEDGFPEGFSTFNFNNHLEEITDNTSNNAIEFYLSFLDVQMEENAINCDAFDNFINT